MADFDRWHLELTLVYINPIWRPQGGLDFEENELRRWEKELARFYEAKKTSSTTARSPTSPPLDTDSNPSKRSAGADPTKWLQRGRIRVPEGLVEEGVLWKTGLLRAIEGVMSGRGE